ncbi:hypothetical protein BH10PAT1_BH10PAT1_5240 [soil metagenome]
MRIDRREAIGIGLASVFTVVLGSAVVRESTENSNTPYNVGQVNAQGVDLIPTESTINMVNPDTVYTGEYIYNNFSKIEGQNEALLNPVKAELLKEFDDLTNGGDRTTILRTNSTLSSLVNKFGKGVSADPDNEPGLSQTRKDIEGYITGEDVLKQLDTMKVSDIFHTNENGLETAGIFVEANNRDFGVAFLATGLAAEKGQIDGNQTLADAWKNKQALITIRGIQNQMFAEMQKTNLGVSKAESDRRTSKDEKDLSNYLPKELQYADQSISCDVERPSADLRDKQLQTPREVLHKEQSTEDLNNSNTENETDLYVTGYNKQTGLVDTDGFTFRGYNGPVVNQIDSAVGEEMRPCYYAQIVIPEAVIILPNPATSVPFEQPTPPPHTDECKENCDHHKQPGKSPNAGDEVNTDGQTNTTDRTGNDQQTGGDDGGTH